MPVKGNNIVPSVNKGLRALHDRLSLVESVLTADQVKKINAAMEKIKGEKKALRDAKLKVSASGFRYSNPNAPVNVAPPIGLTGAGSSILSVGVDSITVGSLSVTAGALPISVGSASVTAQAGAGNKPMSAEQAAAQWNK